MREPCVCSCVRSVLLLTLRTDYRLTNQTDSLNNTGATDWFSLAQRMRYVVPLFRRSQQDTQLVQCPPFTPAQFDMIDKGQKPATADLCLEANCCGHTGAKARRPLLDHRSTQGAAMQM